MALIPMENGEKNDAAEQLTSTQTSMSGKVYAVRKNGIVTLRIEGAFNPSAADPGGNQYYTQISNLPDKYRPKHGSYHDITTVSGYGRLYMNGNKLYVYKSTASSINIYQLLTYVGADI